MCRCDINNVTLLWKQFHSFGRNKWLSSACVTFEVLMLDMVKPPVAINPLPTGKNYYKLKNHVVALTGAQLGFNTVLTGW